jgi:hypothetical protein
MLFRTVLRGGWILALASLVGCGSSAVPERDGGGLDGGGLSGDGGVVDAEAGPSNPDGGTVDTAADSIVLPDGGGTRDGQTADAPDGSGSIADEATLIVSPSVGAFPNTAIGKDSAPFKFTVTNIGYLPSGAVSSFIDGVSASEFVITSSTCGRPLGYNERCDVSLIFRPATDGSKSARLEVTASPGGAALAVLTAISQATSAGTVMPTTGTFNPVSIAQGTTGMTPTFQSIAFTVTNTGGTPVALASSIGGGDAGEFSDSGECNGSILPPNGACMTTVTFAPTTAGFKTAYLSIAGQDFNLTVPLSGTATSPAMLVLSPQMQDFGQVPFGQTNSQLFTVTNNGGQPSGKLSVALVGAPNAGFSITRSTCMDVINPGDQCIVVVTFAPVAGVGVGTKNGFLSVTAPMSGALNASLTGTSSIAPTMGTLTLTSPGGNDPFGQVSLGDMGTALFQLQNSGTVATGKIMATISDSGDFSVSNIGCPDSLNVGEACYITVTFQPSVLGQRTGTLQVIANPGGFATLPLRASAQAGPFLQITPTYYNFGSRLVNTGTTTTPTVFTVRNNGSQVTGPLNVVLEGMDMSSFHIIATDCPNVQLQPRSQCTVRMRFIPTRVGSIVTTLAASAPNITAVRATMTGSGTN